MAQNNRMGSIMGNVVEASSGKAIAAASISLVSISDSSKKIMRISDKNGSFVVKQVPFGYYHLKISFAGYNNDTVEYLAARRKI